MRKTVILKNQILTVFWLTLLMAMPIANAQNFTTNLNQLYASLKFNPTAKDSGVLLQISDIHMASDRNELPNHALVTNLDSRLVSMVTDMSPQPTAMIVTGDLTMSASRAFGNLDFEPAGTNELILAREALKKFTHFPVYIIPGNHDTPPNELTNAALFNSVFTNTSRFTNFVIAGLPVLALDGHNGGWLDAEERDWLMGFQHTLKHDQSVLVAVHQPISNGSAGADGRESARDILAFLAPWRAPVYVMTGHGHFADATTFPMGRTTVSQYVCPSTQQWMSRSTDPRSPSSPGFFLWCISQGKVVGVIEGNLINQSYFSISPRIYPAPLRDLYDGVTNILLKAEEGHFKRSDYKVTVVGGADVVYWRSYVRTYTCQLPLDKYPEATHAFLIANTLSGTSFYFGTNTNSWVAASVEPEKPVGNVFQVTIPDELRAAPLWFMASNSVNEFVVGGFGLTTTNRISARRLN